MGGGMGAMGSFGVIKDAEGNDKLATTVRQLGNKTFFRKGDRWVDSAVKPEDDAKAKVVVQFSDEYFKLARTQSAEMNQYLTFDEPVTVDLGGQVYRIDRPKH
jgi:Ca-activated chloride channel family protein